MDALLLGMVSQIAEREDHVVVEDVRGEPEAVPEGCEFLTPGGDPAAPAEAGREFSGLGF